MRLYVVGVTVAAELVIGDEDVWRGLTDDFDEEISCVGEVGTPERVRTGGGASGLRGIIHRRRVAILTPFHARVAEMAGAAKEAVVRDAEDLHRFGQFADTVFTEAILLLDGEVVQFGEEDFALFSGRTCDERDPVSYTHLTLPTILRV